MSSLATPEQLQEAGIFVMKGYADPGLSRDFAQEWIEIFPQTKAIEKAQAKNLQVARLGGVTAARFCKEDSTPDTPVTRRLLEVLGLHETNLALTLNYQLPHATQWLHPDSDKVVGAIQVLHGSGAGAFDFSLAETIEEAENPDNILSIEGLDAGDLVLQSYAHVIHRGRNMSAFPRITMAMSLVRGLSVP